MLEAPLRWRQPKRVFVNSMADIWHDDISNEQIAAIFAVMAACPQHVFYVLTKRPHRMVEWFSWIAAQMSDDNAPRAVLHDAIGRVYNEVYPDVLDEDAETPLAAACEACCELDVWPLENLWLGVSVEDQQRADERIPLLRQTPAAVRWLSVEPLLEHIELDLRDIDWVAVGGESGHGARQCNAEWIRDIVRRCRRAHVPVFIKQLGAAYCDAVNAVGGAQTNRRAEYGPIRRLKDRKGADLTEWPADLRIREFPTAIAKTHSAGSFSSRESDLACIADVGETDTVEELRG